jgi:hypothetical protein
MNAKNISDVLSILNLISASSLDAFRDPVFIGQLKGAAFTKALPLKYALEKINVEIRDESVSA